MDAAQDLRPPRADSKKSTSKNPASKKSRAKKSARTTPKADGSQSGESGLAQPRNTILHGDCVAGMLALPAGSVDLVFADPPFNIGYDYDVYRDRLEDDQYLGWSRAWIAAVHRALKPTGAFWLAIGDEYAAELKVESRKLGFHCRSWVVWYYTFGVNCKHKYTRSHAHLFHFVKDPDNFTFRDDDPANRIPSARQLVYNDRRANPHGRLPDDTWIIRPERLAGELLADDGTWSLDEIPKPRDDEQTFTLRPQDVESCFRPNEDTWYFPRVAGTFKERAGFHGCQMPEQLLGRIIRACSNEGELVLDPFSGSATTLAVAKKLGRQFLGFDISETYVRHGLTRLESIRVGDRLVGSAEPTSSAPKTMPDGRGKRRGGGDYWAPDQFSMEGRAAREARLTRQQLDLTLQGVAKAFLQSHDGHSIDRLIVDPDLNAAFADHCRRQGLVGNPRTWNLLLLQLRKSGDLAQIETTRATHMSWESCDRFLYASEIAVQQSLDADRAECVDEILCDPELAAEFDAAAQRLAPGYQPWEYRWGALLLSNHAKSARSRSAALIAPTRLRSASPIDEVDFGKPPDAAGVYVLSSEAGDCYYVGEAVSLRERLAAQFAPDLIDVWRELADDGPLQFQTYLTEAAPSDMLAWQCCFARLYKPRWNFRPLCAEL